MRNKQCYCFGLLWLWATTGLADENSVASQLSISLQGPEVVKLNWGIRSPVADDFDNDGLNDLAVINNDRASIELLYQTILGENEKKRKKAVRTDRWEPMLEDARFDRDSIVCGQYLYALTALDFNRDGLTDFAYTGNKDPFTIRFQKPDSDWSETWTYDDLTPSQWTSTLIAADIDGDNHEEILLLADKLLVFSLRRIRSLT